MAEVVCNCGSVKEATEAAEKLFVQMTGTDCPVWTFQVAVALRTICVAALADGKTLTLADMGKAANEIRAEVLKTVRGPDELLAEAAAHRDALYGG